MSRMEKFSRSAKKRRHEMTEMKADSHSEEETLPSRRQKYPSSKNKLTKLYYNLLFVLFVSLVIFLFWYGNEYSNGS